MQISSFFLSCHLMEFLCTFSSERNQAVHVLGGGGASIWRLSRSVTLQSYPAVAAGGAYDKDVSHVRPHLLCR